MAREPSGFTLMEVVLSLALLTVGMLGLSGLFSQVVKADAVSRQKQVAVLLAETKVTQLQMAGLGEIAATRGTFDPPFDAYTWEVQFAYRSDDHKVADLLVEVSCGSAVNVRLWSQALIADGK